MFSKCFSMKYSKYTEVSRNHLKKSIEIYCYMSITQCKTWMIAISASPLMSLPEHHALLPQRKPLLWILCYNPLVFLIVLKTLLMYLFLHNILFSYFFCFSTSHKWNHASCWLTSCNINCMMIRVAVFNCSLFIFSAAKCSVVGMYHSLFYPFYRW